MPEAVKMTGSRSFAAVVQSVFVLSLLWTALFLAWQSLSAGNFLYPLWYELLDIREHIAEYGPQNQFKDDFEATSDERRFELFAGIVDAINRGGEGLESLTYQDRNGNSVQFLHEAELVHLNSVARLLDSLRSFSWFALALFVLSSGLILRKGNLPRPRRVLISALVFITLAALLVLALGAERVFYEMHTWVFPPGEQWFFYYEESLMSTLMKAPDLFGAIAVALVVAALIWAGFFLLVLRYLLLRSPQSTD